MPRNRVLGRLAACIAMTLVASAPRADEIISIDIPAQPLTDSLRALAVASQWNVMFDASLLNHYRSPALSGRYTFEAALGRLLAEGGLSFEFIDQNTVVVLEPDSIGPPRKQVSVAGIGQTDPTPQVDIIGTHLRDSSLEASPLQVFAEEDIRSSGAGTLPELFRKLLYNFPVIGPDTVLNNGGNVFAASNRGRGSAVNLRGLGPGATLVLLNGQRMSPAGSYGQFSDISMIPLSAVERIDILRDGASALYGSDAVAGVVNIALRTNYDGAETSTRYTDSFDGDAQQAMVSQSFGHSWNTGWATLIYEHDSQSALQASERRFIPDQNGPFMVWPSQRRHSAVASFREYLSDSTALEGSFLHSQRVFRQSSTFGAVEYQAEGMVAQSQGALELRQQLVNDWQAAVSVAQTVHDESGANAHVISTFIQPASHFSTRASSTVMDVRADGPMGSIPAGSIRGLIGAEVRREKFDDWSDFGSVGAGLKRRAYSLFGELSIPLMRQAPQSGAQRLSLSLASRYDRYQDANAEKSGFSSVDSRMGVVWSPISGMRFRGTYSQSFRVAPLPQTSESSNALLQLLVSDPYAPDGRAIGLIVTGGNADLKPERANSFTVGFDWTPAALRGLDFSLSYFNIDYAARIATPMVNGSPVHVLSRHSVLAPFITLSPSEEEVRQLYETYPLYDGTGLGYSSRDVDVIFDDRLQNISSTQTEGLDVYARYAMPLGASSVTLDVGAEYLFRMDHRAASTVQPVSIVNTVFNPTGFQLQSRLGWEWGRRMAWVRFNYVGSYMDNLAWPERKVSSWLTTDFQTSVRLGNEEAAGGVRRPSWEIAFGVQNLFDKEPPRISEEASVLGYDPAHASPFGRFAALQMTRRW